VKILLKWIPENKNGKAWTGMILRAVTHSLVFLKMGKIIARNMLS
jgi:hypothetical protein